MKTRQILLSLLTCLSLFGMMLHAQDAPTQEKLEVVDVSDLPATRGYIPVPSSVAATAYPLNTEIVSPAFLGSTTTNFCKCAVYRLSKNLEFTSTSDSSLPMIRVTATGVTFDLSHNCACFSRTSLSTSSSCFSSTASTSANACDVHGVGIEVGWGPNQIGSNTQPDSVTIENGIMCDWDIAILIHAGVRNVVIRNMVFTDNVIPVIALGRNDADGRLTKEVCNITMENVAILGAAEPRLNCLKWIRMFLTNGTAISPVTPAVSATTARGYTNDEVMPLVADPVADQWPDYTDWTKGLYVYPGIYMYGTSNIQLKNVSVNGVGFDGNVATNPVQEAERTAAFGMWFRNCRSIFAEDIEASKTISGLVAAGLYLDNSKVVSVKKGQFTDTSINLLEVANATPVVTPEGLWAAGVVLKDTQNVHFDDVVMSNTRGIDTAWGLRSIYSYYIPLTSLGYDSTIVTRGENYEFENVWADFLHGDRVYGYDFGDIFRKKIDGSVATNLSPTDSQFAIVNGRIATGSVRALRMKNVSTCGCAGKYNGAIAEAEIAKEYKGIFLGDNSGGIQIDGGRIESNKVVAAITAVGINSGVEFGAASQYLNTPAGVSKNVGTIYDLRMNALSISRNTGGYLNNRFVGVRGVSTGASLINTAGTNVFSDVSISNSQIDFNQFDGIRVVDDVDGTAPVTAKSWVLDNVSMSGSTDGHGATFETILSSVARKIKCNLNKAVGFCVQTLIDSVEFSDSQFNQNSASSVDVFGFDAQTAGNCVRFVNSKFDFNDATDANVAGVHIKAGQSISFENTTANCNSSAKNTLVGPFTTRGVYLETSVDNISFVHTQAHNNEATNGDCYGYEVDRATAIFADDMAANNNVAEGTTATNNNVSKVVGIFFKATVGSEQSEGCLLKNLQACGNHNAYLAYGVHMQSPTGLTVERVDASSNIADATGQINAKPVLSQAIGLFIEGGNSVHISDVNTNSNRQLEYSAANLSRYLELGASSADSEANVNLTAQIAHHFAVANQSGAYGTLVKGTSDIFFDGGHACKNDGVRAFGMHAREADNVFVRNVEASENHGNGTPWFSANPFVGLDAAAIDVPDVQAQCFFGGLDPAATVDLRSTYENLLMGLDQFKQNNSASGDLCANVTAEAAQRSSIAYVLLWSTLAQFRRFCTGAGFGFWSCNFPTFEKCRALGNYSEYDSGGGIALYGPAEGALVSDCVAADNRCNQVSQRGGTTTFDINGNIDITQWNLINIFLQIGLLNSETVLGGTAPDDKYGFVAIPNTVIKISHIDLPSVPPATRKPTALLQPEGATTATGWTLGLRDMTVGFPTAAIPTAVDELKNLYDYVLAMPLGVGILMECQRDGFVGESNTYGNKGNAGLGVGILSDGASSTMFLDNKATSNAADALGYAFGLADMSVSTPNIWYKNWMYANRVDEFMNSSYLISFDNVLSQSQTLPVKTIFPGSIDGLVNILPLDNLVVSFVNDRQESDCVADEVSNKWKCLELASPLGSTFSDVVTCDASEKQQILSEVTRQFDYGGFIGKLAHHGPSTVRSGSSGSFEYHRNPFNAKPDLWTVAGVTGYAILDLAWTPDNQYCFAAVSGNGVIVFNRDFGIERIFTGVGTVVSISVKADGRYVAYGTAAGDIKTIDITHENPQLWVDQGALFASALGGVSIKYLRFSPNGSALVAVSDDGTDGKYRAFNTSATSTSSWTALYTTQTVTTTITATVDWVNPGFINANTGDDVGIFVMAVTAAQKLVYSDTLTPNTVTVDYSTPFTGDATCVATNRTVLSGTNVKRLYSKILVGEKAVSSVARVIPITTANLTGTAATITNTLFAAGTEINCGTTDVVNITFKPDADYAFVTQNNGSVVTARLFNLTGSVAANWVQVSGSPITTTQTGTVPVLAWDNNGELLMIGSNSSASSYLASVDTSSTTVADWLSTASLKQNAKIAAPTAIAYNATSKQYAVAQTGSAIINVYDVSKKQQKLKATPSHNVAAPTVLEFSQDGQYLFSAGVSQLISGNNVDKLQATDLITLATSTITIASDSGSSPIVYDIKSVQVDGIDYLAIAIAHIGAGISGFVYTKIVKFDRTTSTFTDLGSTLTNPGIKVLSVAISADAKRLVTGSFDDSSNNIKYWNISNPTAPVLLATITDHGSNNVTSVDLSPDGKTIVSAGASNVVMLHDVTSETKPVLVAQKSLTDVKRVAFMPDGQHLAAAVGSGGTPTNTVHMFTTSMVHTATLGAAHQAKGDTGSINYMAVGKDSDVYVGSAAGAHVINYTHPAHSMHTYHSLAPHSYDIAYKVVEASGNHLAVAYSKDGRYTFAIDNTTRQSLLVYNSQGIVIKKFAMADIGAAISSLNCVAVHPYHDVLVVGTTGHAVTNIRYLNFSKTDKSQWAFVAVGGVTDPVQVASFSPAGDFLVALSKATPTDIQRVAITDPYDSTTWAVTTGVAALTNGLDVAWHPKGEYYAVANNGVGISVFPTTSFTDAGPLVAGGTNPRTVSFNFDGSLLASVNVTGEVRTYNSSHATPSVTNWTQISNGFAILTNPLGMRFHPTKSVFLASTTTKAHAFDVRDGDISKWSRYDSAADTFTTDALAFNPQGTRAHVGRYDVDISSKDVGTWVNVISNRAAYTGFDTVNMSVNPAGTKLVAADGSSTALQLWDITNKNYYFSAGTASAVMNVTTWSPDGKYIFAAKDNAGSLIVDVFYSDSISSGPITTLTVALGAGTAAQCIAATTINGDDYLVIGINDNAPKIRFAKYSRGSQALSDLGTLSFSGTKQVNAAAWNSTGTKLLTGGNTGEVGYFTFDPSGPTLTPVWTPSIDTTVHGTDNVTAVDISLDGTLLVSADDSATGKVAAHNLTTGVLLGTALTRTAATKAIKFSHDGQRLAVLYDTGTGATDTNNVDVTTFTATPVFTISNTYTLGKYALNGASHAVAWGGDDVDLYASVDHALTVTNDVHPLIVAIAQDMVNNSGSTLRANKIGHELARLAGYQSSDVDSAITTVQTYIQSNPTDVAGSIRTLQATTFGQALQASARHEMSKASANHMRAYLKDRLKTPEVAAATTLSQHLELPIEQVRAHANDISAYIRDHARAYAGFDCSTGSGSEVLKVDPMLKAVASVINTNLANKGVEKGTLILQGVYPEATHPGLARLVAVAGFEHLSNHSGDTDGAAEAMNRAFVKAGVVDAQDKLCKGLGGYVVAYINAAKLALDHGGMKSAKIRTYDSVTTAAKVVADHEESYNLVAQMYDQLRANPANATNLTNTRHIVAGYPIGVTTFPTATTDTTTDYSTANQLKTQVVDAFETVTNAHYIDNSKAIHVPTARKVRRSIEGNSGTAGKEINIAASVGGLGDGTNGVHSANYADNIISSTIASSIVGSAWAKKATQSAAIVVGDLILPSDAAKMATRLINGYNAHETSPTARNPLLPDTAAGNRGYLYALRGDRLKVGSAPYTWAASNSTLPATTFKSLGEYLTALHDDLLARGFTTTPGVTTYTGLINSIASYTSLSDEAKEVIARAIIYRTMLSGDESVARGVFGTTSVVANVAAVVPAILDGTFTGLFNASAYATGTAAATPGFVATAAYPLDMATKQAIALMAILWIDQTAFSSIDFSPNADQYHAINVIIKGAYLAATSVQGLSVAQQVNMAILGGVATTAGFVFKPAIRVNSTTDFASQIGTELAKGMFDSCNFMQVRDFGTTGLDGLAMDLSEQVLATVASVAVLETATSTGSAAGNSGAYAAPLAYNLLYQDTLFRAMASLTVNYGIDFGKYLGLFSAGSSAIPNANQAAVACARALGQAELQRSRDELKKAYYIFAASGALIDPILTAGPSTDRSFTNHVADIMKKPTTHSINPTAIVYPKLFAVEPITAAPYGHPADSASALAQQGTLSSEEANGVADRVNTYLTKTDYKHVPAHQYDTDGADRTACQR